MVVRIRRFANMCLLSFCLSVLHVGCWTETRDVHGRGGTPHSFTRLKRCQDACIRDISCVAVDWDPTNSGRECWKLTDIATSPTTQKGVITHYEINRLYCPS